MHLINKKLTLLVNTSHQIWRQDKKFKEIHGEEIYVTYSPETALLARDSLAKLIFKKLFDYICEKLNISLLNGYDPKKNKK